MMSCSVVFLVNEASELEPEQTTSLLIAESARRCHHVWVVDAATLEVRGAEVWGLAGRARPNKAELEALTWFELSGADLVWIRTNPARAKDANVHARVPDLMRLVQLAGARVLNDPTGLQTASSKLYLSYFPTHVRPETIVSRSPESLIEFASAHTGGVVFKPLAGTHGRDVFKLTGVEQNNARQIAEILCRQGHVIAQEFIPEATQGDVRVLMLEGNPLEVRGELAAVCRRPPEHDFRSNISAGGSAHPVKLDHRQRSVLNALSPRLKRDGIFLAGVDLIGSKVVEVNVFSPGGLLDSARFYDRDFVSVVVERALA